jgi:HTH-type transcriptional regulator/antitoxin HigA
MAGKKIVRIDNRKYGELLAQARPRAPRNIQESRRLTAQFGVLMDKGDSLTPEESELLRLLGSPITQFEKTHFRIPDPKPYELLKGILEESGLKQRDLLDIFGLRSTISEVLAGKRAITKSQALKLAERFKIHPEAFIDWSGEIVRRKKAS